MPNHITNIVQIDSIYDDEESNYDEQTKKLEDLYEALSGDDSEGFDFNAVIPMAESLHITSGTQTDIGLAAYDQETFDDSEFFIKRQYPQATTPAELKTILEASDDEADKLALELGKAAYDNIQKYGHATWYSWSIANWGTKWNAYGVKWIQPRDGEHIYGTLLVSFQTAWSPPVPVFTKLKEMGFRVQYSWIDEGADEWHNWEEIK